MPKKKAYRVQGLRKRWITNSVGPVVMILLVVGTIISALLAGNYYENAHTVLKAKAAAGADYFNSYMMTNYNNYYRNAALYAATFEGSDRIELQFLNSSGRIETSSRGMTAGARPGTPDVSTVLQEGAPGWYSGPDPLTGERILAASSPLTVDGTVVGVMRYVTSTRELDRQVLLVVGLTVAAMVGITLLIIISNLFFINSVVEPVAAVTEAAKRISAGSYGIRIPNKYSDEMAQLVDNINDMSVKIGQSEKTQTEFVSSVSHELRTPLTAISGWGETLLEDRGQDRKQLMRGLDIILKESRRLSNMVEELLDFSRMQDGRFTLQVEPVDLQAELEDAIFTYQELFRQEGIALTYTSEEEYYERPISGDPERLKQVFCNVLDNAAKHGGSGRKIDASLRQEQDNYIIRIRDYGPGIPEAELPFVKQKFYKGSSKARGSGIGLAVCDEIIQRHGGTFTVANALGGGAVVTITLPIEETEIK